jgi:hypothetical protein
MGREVDELDVKKMREIKNERNFKLSKFLYKARRTFSHLKL